MRQLITISICPSGECIWKITLKTNCIKTRSMVWGHAVDTGSFLPKQRNPPRPIKRGKRRNATNCTRSPATLPVTGREAFWARAQWHFNQASDADLSTRREFKSLKFYFCKFRSSGGTSSICKISFILNLTKSLFKWGIVNARLLTVEQTWQVANDGPERKTGRHYGRY